MGKEWKLDKDRELGGETKRAAKVKLLWASCVHWSEKGDYIFKIKCKDILSQSRDFINIFKYLRITISLYRCLDNENLRKREDWQFPNKQ
jgi:hypothetical protein